MPLAERPIEPHNFRNYLMEDEIDGEEEYEIIDINDDYDTIIQDYAALNALFTDEDSDAENSDSDQDSFRKMSCVPSTDHASFIFRKHTGPVFCVGINPKDEHIVITGGQDERAIVWNTQTGDVLHESNEFKDSVSHASFNHDGKFVCAVDMCGTIKVWKTTSQPFQLVFQDYIDDVQWMKWHQVVNALLVGESTGAVYLWKMPTAECKVLPGDRDLTDVGGFMPDGKRAIVCYLNGIVKVFNLVNCSVVMKYDPPELNSDNFISMDVHPDNNIVALGALSSRLYIAKTQGGKMLHEFTCVEERDRGENKTPRTSIECVAFARKLPYNFVVAATDNALHVYDYVKLESRGIIQIEEGVTRLVWPEESHLIYIGTKVGRVAVCDVRALQRVGTIEGHSKSILDIAITKDSKTLITTSDDRTVRLFPIDEITLNEVINTSSTDEV